MKRNLSAIIVLCIALVFLAFCGGYILGEHQTGSGLHILLEKSETTVNPTDANATGEAAPPSTTDAQPTPPPATTAPGISHVATIPEPEYPIDLNTATAEDLMTLPGIGEVLASRIIAWRETYGLFPSVEALSAVEGIGEKRIEAIYDYITVEVPNEDSGS